MHKQLTKTIVFRKKQIKMYKLSTLILAFIILICLGCNDDQSITIDIPNDVELDLDQDGVSDFVIAYSLQTEGDPEGNYQAVRMHIESLNEDQVLKNEDQYHHIFLTETNVIETEVESPFFWEKTNPSSHITTPIARIRTDYDLKTWNDKWTVFSLEESETYIMGFKLLGGNNSQIGFIEFSVDTQTGQFNLLKTTFL